MLLKHQFLLFFHKQNIIIALIISINSIKIAKSDIPYEAALTISKDSATISRLVIDTMIVILSPYV